MLDGTSLSQPESTRVSGCCGRGRERRADRARPFRLMLRVTLSQLLTFPGPEPHVTSRCRGCTPATGVTGGGQLDSQRAALRTSFWLLQGFF